MVWLLRQAPGPDGSLQPYEATASTGAGAQEQVRYFGDFELLREVGRGGMGIVYKVRQVSLNRVVALKLIAPEQLSSPKAVERFHTEAEAAANLDHPNIVPIYDTGTVQGRHYFSMKLIEGQSLAQRIADFRLPMADSKSRLAGGLRSQIANRQLAIANLMATIADAVHFAHQRGILHRDLKPGNILLDSMDQPHVSDFGLAKRVQGDSTLTLSGEVLGTPAYMSPEQAAGKANQITTGADIYSLGVILYELLAGRLPFGGATSLEIFHDLIHIEPPAPRSFNRAVSRDLKTICLKCLQKEPAKRYPTAAALAEELRRFERGEPIHARPASQTEKIWRWCRRKPGLAATLALLVIVLASGLTGILWEWRSAVHQALIARENLYATDISLARQAEGENNLRQAREILKKQIPKPGEKDLRGFEWRYLWNLCRSEELAGWQGDRRHMRSVVFSPDGQTLATGGDDCTVKLWNLQTHQQSGTLAGTSEVYSVSFSPRGDVLAAATFESVVLWDLKAHQPLRVLQGASLKASFSPDSHYLLTRSTNGLMLWDVETWRAKRLEFSRLSRSPFDDADSNNLAIGFSGDGNWIGAATTGGLKLIRTANFEEMRMFNDRIPYCRFIAFSPCSGTLAACTTNYTDVKIWHIEDGQETRVLLGHSDTVYAACFTPDGNRVATGGADHTIKLWDVKTGSLLHTFQGHEDEVWDLAFSPDGKVLASVSKDGAVKLWDCVRITNPAPSLKSVIPLGFTAKGDLLGLETNKALVAFNPATLEVQRSYSFPDLQGEVDDESCRLLEDGRTLAIGIRSRFMEETGWNFRLWDLNERRFTASLGFTASFLAEHPVPVYAPSRGLVAVRTTPNNTVIWQLPLPTQKFVLPHSGIPSTFSADGTLLAVDNLEARGVTVWKIGEAKVSKFAWAAADVEFPDGPSVLSPDGTVLAKGEQNGSIGLWSIPSGRRLASLIGHKRGFLRLAFSPDGRTLASTSYDGTVRLWHVASARELMSFQLPARNLQVPMVMFSQDSRSLIGRVGNGFLTRLFYAPALTELGTKSGPFQP